MKISIRLAKPVPVTFEHKGMSRVEVIGRLEFQSHYGDPEGVPSEELIEQVWSVIDQDGYERDEPRDFDLAQGLIDSYIDAGWRAEAFIAFMIRHDEAGDVPMLDVTPMKGRRTSMHDVLGRRMRHVRAGGR